MSDICSVSFALDPTNVPSFLLDWEVTKRCNLDCTYCGPNEHDNTTEHPPLSQCLKSIDFMYEYVDQYMRHIRPSQRKVVLNVYGGESLFHPNIIEILEQVRARYQPYQDRWHLTVSCTTNGVVGSRQFERIIPLVDYFSMSYHAEGMVKQQQMYFDNLLALKQANKPVKAIVMMHNKLWSDSERAIEFCKTHGINYLAKVVDAPVSKEFKYQSDQLEYMKVFWMTKAELDPTRDVLEQGRACCGGRKLSVNGDLRSRVNYVDKQGFRGWSCSVNWYFLFVEQLTGLVYTNKDCKTSTSGRVEPLGSIENSHEIISHLQQQFKLGMPVITCVKDRCACGYCAPKAKSPDQLLDLLGRHVTDIGVFDSGKSITVQ